MNLTAHQLPRGSLFVGFLLTLVASELAILALHAQSDLPSPAPKTLLKSIQKVLHETDTPGAGLALVSRKRLEWVGGVGYADVETGRLVTGTTLFRIGSISNIFVALSVLRLQERGHLELGDFVSSLAPGLEIQNPWTQSHPLTLTHLLEHTGGLDDLQAHECAHTSPIPISLREGLALRPAHLCRWPPGKLFSYSEVGPAMAALVVESITGQPFESYVEEKLFTPLGMERSTFYPDERLARGYVKGRSAEYQHLGLRASGAVNSSPSEMAALLLLFLNRGQYRQRQVLKPESIYRMETPSTSLAAQNGIRTGYGLCLNTTIQDGFLVHGLSGSIGGYRSHFEYLPYYGKGFVLFINSTSTAALSRSARIVRQHLLKDLPQSQPPRSKIPAWRIAGLAGYYRPISPRRELNRFLGNLLGVIRLDLEGNQLRIAGKNPNQVLIPLTDRRFRGPDDPIPSAVFVKDQGRMILQGTGRIIEGSYIAVPSWRLWLERAAAVTACILMLSGLAFAFSWVPLRLMVRIRERTWIGLGLLPTLASATMLLGTVVVAVALNDPVQRLGNLTFWSFSIFALGCLFAAFAILSMLQSVRGLTWTNTRLEIRILALASSCGSLGIVVYLWSHGIVGLRTWIY